MLYPVSTLSNPLTQKVRSILDYSNSRITNIFFSTLEEFYKDLPLMKMSAISLSLYGLSSLGILKKCTMVALFTILGLRIPDILSYIGSKVHSRKLETLAILFGANLNQALLYVDPADIEMIRQLVSLGANVNQLDVNYETLMHKAALRGDSRMVQALIDLGADPLLEGGCTPTPVPRKAGFSALDYATASGSVECVKILKQTPTLHHVCIAASFGHVPFLQYLIEDCHLPVEGIYNGETCRLFSSNQFRGLLKKGSFESPLYFAISNSKIDAVRYLLTKGVDITKQGFGFSVSRECAWHGNALHLAAAVGNLDAIKLLIEKGVDLTSEVSVIGDDIIHIAASCDHRKILDYMKSNYSGLFALMINRKNRDGKTPLLSFCQSSESPYLWVFGYLVPGIKPTGMIPNTYETIIYLVKECGADINAIDSDGKTALHHLAKHHYLIRSGESDPIRYLLDVGATVVSDNEGKTFLDVLPEEKRGKYSLTP
jgi:ankyrin repeat protein